MFNTSTTCLPHPSTNSEHRPSLHHHQAHSTRTNNILRPRNNTTHCCNRPITSSSSSSSSSSTTTTTTTTSDDVCGCAPSEPTASPSPHFVLAATCFENPVPLPSGRYSSVFLAIHRPTGLSVVVKTYLKRDILRRKNDAAALAQRVRVERAALARAPAPTLLAATHDARTVALVMRRVPGIPLSDCFFLASPATAKKSHPPSLPILTHVQSSPPQAQYRLGGLSPAIQYPEQKCPSPNGTRPPCPDRGIRSIENVEPQISKTSPVKHTPVTHRSIEPSLNVAAAAVAVHQHPENALLTVSPASATRALVYALERLHHAKIIHLDLTLENVLLDLDALRRGDAAHAAVIIDLGAAELEEEPEPERDYTECTTVDILPPELVEGVELPTYASDIWALGVCVYRMVTGRLSPFRVSGGDYAVLQRISKHHAGGPILAGTGTGMDENAADFIQRCLHPDPGTRLGVVRKPKDLVDANRTHGTTTSPRSPRPSLIVDYDEIRKHPFLAQEISDV